MIDDLLTGVSQRLALVGESMAHRPPRPWDPLDETTLDHPAGQRAEGLVGLEGQLREVVQGRVGLLCEVPQVVRRR